MAGPPLLVHSVGLGDDGIMRSLGGCVVLLAQARSHTPTAVRGGSISAFDGRVQTGLRWRDGAARTFRRSSRWVSVKRVTGVIVVDELWPTAGAVVAIACAETTTSAGVMRMMGRAQPPLAAAQRR
jgi:hypothetical protein